MTNREKVIRGLKETADDLAAWETDVCPKDRGQITKMRQTVMDALDLLKEDRPRVLPFSEIKAFDGVVWLEDVDKQAVIRAICNGYVVTHDLLAFSAKTGSPVGMVDDYNKRWRAWTACPTDEQRQETVWDGL